MKMRMILGRVLTWSLCLLAVTWVAPSALADGRATGQDQVYRSTEDFVAAAFDGATPPPRALWIEPTLRDELSRIYGWNPGLRVRFWQRAGRTVWILDEIGKDKPITAGIVVDDGAIAAIEVLTFRESRGWEVRYPFFTDQFTRAALSGRGELTQPIDGITGATLSVRAMKRMARVALRLHDETQQTTLARRP